MKPSTRVSQVQPSPTMAISALAAKMRADGVDVLSFSAGEPDFDTPAPVVEAMVAAARSGKTRYAPINGMPELRQAIAARMERRYGQPFDPADIMVTVGGKQAVYNALMALVNPGDHVLVPAPYWVSYPSQIQLAGGEAIYVPCSRSRGLDLDVPALEVAVTPRTRGVIVNTPNNPSGACYSAASLDALADLMRRRKLWAICDDIYGDLVYGAGSGAGSGSAAPFISLLQRAPDLREQIVIVDGVAKTWAMTGWRIGYIWAPPKILAGCRVIQSQSTSSATTFAQVGAAAAMNMDMSFLDEWRDAYIARRDRLVAGLNAIDGVRCDTPQGAFYAFPDVTKMLTDKGLADDAALCRALLETAGVHLAFVPGSAFGTPGHVRISYACSLEEIDAGLARLRRFAAQG